jgi:hypothetical protein
MQVFITVSYSHDVVQDGEQSRYARQQQASEIAAEDREIANAIKRIFENFFMTGLPEMLSMKMERLRKFMQSDATSQHPQGVGG